MSLKQIPIWLVVAALSATITLHPGQAAFAEARQPIVIEIVKFEFQPRKVTLRPGDLVVWKNRDIVPHRATAKDGSWDSGSIEAGGSWQTLVTEDMLGDYTCVFHPSMRASLDVRTE